MNWRHREPAHAERIGGALARWLADDADPAAHSRDFFADPTLVAVRLALAPAVDKLRSNAAAAHLNAARLHAVLQSVDSAILATSADHRRLFANAAAERLFGLPAGANERLSALARIPQLVQWIATACGAADAGPAPPPANAGRLPLADGRTLQVYVTPLAASQPRQPNGCVIVARDITETVRLETARRDFIAAISHELRTPLTSIQGYAELLQQNPALPPETREQFLNVMLHNTMRLTRMARDLVTLSSLETGTYPFHFAVLDAAALVPPALAVIEPLALEHGCRIEVVAVAPAPLRVDPEAMHRVLLNLLDNAIVHGGQNRNHPHPAAAVFVSGAVEGDEYVFRVRDTGAGISSADQLRVFERFFRVEKSHAKSPGGDSGHGTGLGLALVKHIVREHAGQVELLSALGHGSTFAVRLPLFHDHELAGPAAAASIGSIA